MPSESFLFVRKVYTFFVSLYFEDELVQLLDDIVMVDCIDTKSGKDSSVEYLTPNWGRWHQCTFSFQCRWSEWTESLLAFRITAVGGRVVQRSEPFSLCMYKLNNICTNTNDPVYIFYKDQGKKHLGVSLIVTLQNADGNVEINQSFPLEAKLMYDNGLVVFNQSLLTLTEISHPLELTNGHASLVFRINEVSLRHGNLRFVIRLSVPSHPHIAPSNSLLIEVRSKRTQELPSPPPISDEPYVRMRETTQRLLEKLRPAVEDINHYDEEVTEVLKAFQWMRPKEEEKEDKHIVDTFVAKRRKVDQSMGDVQSLYYELQKMYVSLLVNLKQ